MRTIARTLLLLATATLAACDGSPTAAGPPAVLNVVSGNDQQGPVGQELAQPLVVQVLDDDGKPVRGQLVNFRVTRGGGSVFAGSSITNREGIAQERWTLGTVADSQRVEARAVDPETGAALVFATFRAMAVPGTVASVAAVGATTRTGDAGAAAADSLAVRATDAHGNPVSGVSVAWSVVSGGGTVTPSTATTGANGVAKALWSLGPRVDSGQVARAAVAGATPVDFTATAAVPASAVLEKVSGDQQSAPSGSTLPAPLVVRLRLADGRNVQGAAINWIAGSVANFMPPQSRTDAQGLASSSWTLPPAIVGGIGAAAQVNGGGQAVAFSATATPISTRFLTIAAGRWHSCGVAEDGDTYCWGRNDAGQLGTGATTNLTEPARIAGTHAFTSLTLGGAHSCGLTAAGAAWCWGSNAQGQLGTGNTTSSNTPVAVAGGHSFWQLTAGEAFTCGITTDRTVLCWGNNASGQLGDGTTDDRWVPTAITPVSGGGFEALDAGREHTCGSVFDPPTNQGITYCWGSNSDGQLGPGFSGAQSATPVVAGGGMLGFRYVQLAAGDAFTCARSPRGGLNCWGSNSAGQRGAVSGTIQNLVHITAGAEHACARTSGGAVFCWGSNADGQGGNSGAGGGTPVQVPGDWEFLSAGGSHTCAVTEGRPVDTEPGYAFCWGNNAYGQLGDGSTTSSSTPVRVR